MAPAVVKEKPTRFSSFNVGELKSYMRENWERSLSYVEDVNDFL